LPPPRSAASQSPDLRRRALGESTTACARTQVRRIDDQAADRVERTRRGVDRPPGYRWSALPARPPTGRRPLECRLRKPKALGAACRARRACSLWLRWPWHCAGVEKRRRPRVRADVGG
jgi:hypothetical protein